MGFVIFEVCLYWVIGSILLSRKASRQLVELGIKPWVRGWHFKWMFRLLPKPEQAVYDRIFKHQWMLMLSGAAFAVLAILVTGTW